MVAETSAGVAAKKRNVNVMFAITALSTLFIATSQSGVFDSYLFMLSTRYFGSSHANKSVGMAESISGLTSLVFAIPVGLAVDHFDRVKVARLGGIIGIIASASGAFALLKDDLYMIFVNLALWGIYWEISSSSSEAIFADSMTQGQRSHLYTLKGILATVWLGVGPLLTIGFFLVFGDHWVIGTCHIPLIFGMLTFAPACSLLSCFFSKTEVLTDSIDSTTPTLLQVGDISTAATTSSDFDDDKKIASKVKVRPRINASANHQQEEEEDIYVSALATTRRTHHHQRQHHKFFFSSDKRSIPYFVTVSNFFVAVGAGMTVKFFPLFFKNDYSFTPMHVCILSSVYPLCIAVFMKIAQKLSKKLGRAQASFLWQLCGTSCLLCMSRVYNLPLLIALFLIRGAFQNSCSPLDRSILMDYTESKHRGRWNAIESLTSMTWSGSAILGGWSADTHDYRFTFMITAVLYAIGLAFYAPLLLMVPREEEASMSQRDSSDTLEQPLMFQTESAGDEEDSSSPRERERDSSSHY